MKESVLKTDGIVCGKAAVYKSPDIPAEVAERFPEASGDAIVFDASHAGCRGDSMVFLADCFYIYGNGNSPRRIPYCNIAEIHVLPNDKGSKHDSGAILDIIFSSGARYIFDSPEYHMDNLARLIGKRKQGIK